jgi:hypothetical protein
MNDDIRNLLGKAGTHVFRSATGRCRQCGIELTMMARMTGGRLCPTCSQSPDKGATQTQTPSATGAVSSIVARLLPPPPPPSAQVSPTETRDKSEDRANPPSPATTNCLNCGAPLPLVARITGRTQCEVCKKEAGGITRVDAEFLIQINKGCGCSATYVRGPWGLRSGAVGKFTFETDAIVFTSGMFQKASFRIPVGSIADIVIKSESGGLQMSTNSGGSGSFSHSSTTVSQRIAKYVYIGHLDDTGAAAIIAFGAAPFADTETIYSKLQRALHDFRARSQ